LTLISLGMAQCGEVDNRLAAVCAQIREANQEGGHCGPDPQRLKRPVLWADPDLPDCGANSQKQLCPNRQLGHRESERVTVMFCGAQDDYWGWDEMARSRTRVPRKSAHRRLTVTMTPVLDRYLKTLAKANQRSRAWVINYAINEIRDKYGDNPAPVLPVRTSSPYLQGDEDR
jgi:hypothetical protein